MKKKLIIIIILGLLLLVSTFGEEPKKEDFINNAPKDYDKLLQAYKQMVDFAFRWKELYEKEAKLNEELLQKLDVLTAKIEEMQKTIERMDKTIDVLQSVIMRFFQPQVGIIGLYNLNDKSISVGASFKF